MAIARKIDSGRVDVEGRYINPSTYKLSLKNGEEFLTIKEGEEFEVAGREWIATRVPNKSGNGTVLLCTNWDDEKFFHLLHNKTGSWAVSLEEAKKGIFKYGNILEDFLKSRGFSQRVSYVDEITKNVSVGGKVKIGRSNYPYLYLATDGSVEALPHKKKDLFYEVEVKGASYLVETFRNNESGVVYPKKIIIKKGTDYSKVIKVLEENLETQWLTLK